MRRDLTADAVEGNLRFRPFGEASFIEDLRTAAGVIAGAGFTLMGEAVYLRRPMLAVPLAQQFEQHRPAARARRLVGARGRRPGLTAKTSRLHRPGAPGLRGSRARHHERRARGWHGS
jgi:UDP:flavonoid glycosyltransferase YjiC (YdhE family)